MDPLLNPQAPQQNNIDELTDIDNRFNTVFGGEGRITRSRMLDVDPDDAAKGIAEFEFSEFEAAENAAGRVVAPATRTSIIRQNTSRRLAEINQRAAQRPPAPPRDPQDDDPSLLSVGGVARLAGIVGTSAAIGATELVNGVDITNATDGAAKAITSGLDGVRKQASFPQTARVQQNLAQLAADFDERDDDTFVTRGLATLGQIFTGDGSVYATETIVQGLAELAGGGGLVGAGRGAASRVIDRAVDVAPTIAAGRALQRVQRGTGKAVDVVAGRGNLGNATIASGVIFGQRAQQETEAHLKSLGPSVFDIPSMRKWLETQELIEGRTLSADEAISGFAEFGARKSKYGVGFLSALATRVSGHIEARTLDIVTRGAPTQLGGTFRSVVGREALFEGAEEVVQSSAPELGTQSLDADGLDFQNEELEQSFIVGALFGGTTAAALNRNQPSADPLSDGGQPSAPTEAPAEPDADPNVDIPDATGAARERNVLTAFQDDQVDAERETSLRRRSALRDELGFYPSERLTTLYNQGDLTTEDEARLADLVDAERTAAASQTTGGVTGGAITVDDFEGGTFSADQTQAFRDLRRGDIGFQQFVDAFGGPEARVLDLAEAAFDGRDVPGELALSFETPGAFPVEGDPVSMEVFRNAYRLGEEDAQLDARVQFARAIERDVSNEARFGRDLARNIRPQHPEDANHPVEQYQTYYSEGDTAFTVNPSDGEVAFKDGDRWRDISEASPQVAREASVAAAVAAIGTPGTGRDSVLQNILDRDDGRGFRAVRVDTAEREISLEGEQDAFVQTLAEQQPELAATRRAAIDARAEWVNSEQARELWDASISGLDGVVVPPVDPDLTQEAAQSYAQATLSRVTQEADRLSAIFENENPAARRAGLGRELVSRGLIASDGEQVQITGNQEINALIRQATATATTPAQRYRLATAVLNGRTRELPGTGRNPPISLQDADGQVSPQLARVAEEVRDMALREARFNRIAGLRTTVDVNRAGGNAVAAFGVDTGTINQAIDPLADTVEVNSGIAELAQAIVSTPGAVSFDQTSNDPLADAPGSRIPLSRDALLAEQATDDLGVVQNASQNATTEEDLEYFISVLDRVPRNRRNEGVLNDVGGAARALRHEYVKGPSAPVAALLRGRDIGLALQHEIGKVWAFTGPPTFENAQMSFDVSPTVGVDEDVDIDIEGFNGRLAASMETVELSRARNTFARFGPSNSTQTVTLTEAMDADLIRSMSEAAPSLTNREIRRVITDEINTTPEQRVEQAQATESAALTVIDAMQPAINEAVARARNPRQQAADFVKARLGGDKPFRLGERVDNPMDQALLRKLVGERQAQLRELGIELRVHNSLEAYKEQQLSRIDITADQDRIVAMETEINQTPSFTARWVPALTGDRGGVVDIIANTFSDRGQLERTLDHELIAHYRLPDILGPTGYERLRSLVTTATAKRDPQIAAARERVLDRVVETYNGPLSTEQVRNIASTRENDLIANEVLAELVETPPTDSTEGLSAIGKLFMRTGLSPQNRKTEWVRTLLKISKDSLDPAGGLALSQKRIARLQRQLNRLEGDDVSTADVVRERGLLRAYRNVINSESNMLTIEAAMRGALPDTPEVGDRWRDLRIAQDRVSGIGTARHKISVANLDDLEHVNDTMWRRSGMEFDEFHDHLDTFMTARAAQEKYRYLVLAKMPTGHTEFEDLRRQHIAAARNAVDSTSAEVTEMLQRIQDDADALGVDAISDAFKDGSPVWEALTGQTQTHINAWADGSAGAHIRKLIADTEGDELSFEAAVSAVRDGILANQIESGTYGTRGANMIAASKMVNYVPDLGVGADTETDVNGMRALFRPNNPIFKALTKRGEATENDQPGRADDALWITDPAPLPRNAFNVSLSGRRSISTVNWVKAFDRRAYTTSYEVGTSQVHRALVAAVDATQNADNEAVTTTNIAGIATIERNIDFSTPEAQAEFRKKLDSGTHMVAYDSFGTPTLVDVKSQQLLTAMTDRFITQAQIEQNWALNRLGRATRMYGRILTSYDPRFVLFTQFPRDLWEASVREGLSGQLDVKGAVRVGRDGIRNISRLAGYYFSNARGQQDKLAEFRKAGAGTWQFEFAKFIDNGGEQSFTQQFEDPTNNPLLRQRGFFGQAAPDANAQERTLAGRAVDTVTGAGRAVDNVVEGVTGRRIGNANVTRDLESTTNLFDNAVRFAIFQATKQREINSNGLNDGAATTSAVDVARSLMPFNRRSNMSRRLAPWYVFMNSAVASLSVAVERRIWNNEQMPLTTVVLPNGQQEIRPAEGWANQLNKRMIGAMFAKGAMMTFLGLSFIGDDDDDTGVKPYDAIPAQKFLDGVVFPGGVEAGRRGETLPFFAPEQLGITGMAHAVGAAAALLVKGYPPGEVTTALMNSTLKNMTPLNVSFDNEQDGVSSLLRGLTPTIAGVATSYAFDTDVFGRRISDLGDGEGIQGFRPSTGGNPGLVAALRELEEATRGTGTVPGTNIPTETPGVSMDPGTIEFIADQFGLAGDGLLGALDQIGKMMANEPGVVERSLIRNSRAVVNSAQYATTRAFYRYKRDYLDVMSQQFKDLNAEDERNGDVSLDRRRTFTREDLNKFGPLAFAWAKDIPAEVWDARKTASRLNREVRKIKVAVDVAREQGRGDEVAGLLNEEQQLYADAVQKMEIAFGAESSEVIR